MTLASPGSHLGDLLSLSVPVQPQTREAVGLPAVQRGARLQGGLLRMRTLETHCAAPVNAEKGTAPGRGGGFPDITEPMPFSLKPRSQPGLKWKLKHPAG